MLTEQQRKNWETWLNALESGEYRQGRKRLKRMPSIEGYNMQPSFCCLGVACHLMSNQGNGLYDDDEFLYKTTYYDTLPPKQLMVESFGESFGTVELIEYDYRINHEKCKGILAKFDEKYKVSDPYVSALNDAGFTFAEIAQLLRKTYLED